ncbi:hypothetical protein CC78DRAFT_577181 [Lojkania enalia]|uniref:Uncharacterized protein n=1 Tax=Lojkania enalia TaxID=147567 RepID=A0A9P4KIY2_9PLEO|nr:hypothetical protein CC78DRAFT_577181 [Didymosphaeria enalia]
MRKTEGRSKSGLGKTAFKLRGPTQAPQGDAAGRKLDVSESTMQACWVQEDADRNFAILCSRPRECLKPSGVTSPCRAPTGCGAQASAHAVRARDRPLLLADGTGTRIEDTIGCNGCARGYAGTHGGCIRREQAGFVTCEAVHLPSRLGSIDPANSPTL